MGVNCDICGKKVKERQGFPEPMTFEWTINSGIVGPVIPLKGHKVCLENVNDLVVRPNRRMLGEILNMVKNEKGRPNRRKKEITDFLNLLERKLNPPED